jgi:hypothetical protein
MVVLKDAGWQKQGVFTDNATLTKAKQERRADLKWMYVQFSAG